MDEQLIRLVDHIEMIHEREVTPGTSPVDVARMHVDMHRLRDDWGHEHTRKGDIIWDYSVSD
jgi:hypothetical protein